MKTQKEFILKKLLKDGFVTRNYALRNYISRLSAIIHSLRHDDGMDIEGEFIETKTPFGKGRDYKYFIPKKK